MPMAAKLNNPLAVAEQRSNFAVETDTVDVDILGTHHKVYVLNAAVHTVFGKLLRSHSVAVSYRRGVTCAECKV